MNKKRFLLIPAGLLFFILLIYTSSDYDSSRFLFVTRNILIYIFLASLVLLAMIAIKDLLVSRFKQKVRLIAISVGVLGIGVLAVVGQIQYRIIEIYEIPDQIACDYYDQYNNLLYNSFGDECPILTNYELDGSVLSFELYELVNGVDRFHYYTAIEVEYTETIITRYTKTVYQKTDSGIANISRHIQSVELGDDYVSVTDSYYFDSSPQTTSESYLDYIFGTYNYYTTTVAQLGAENDDNTAELTITYSNYFPYSDVLASSEVMTGNASAYKVDVLVEDDIFPYYVSQGNTSVTARYWEYFSPSTYAIFSYNSVNLRLTDLLGFVDIGDRIENHEDIIFPDAYAIEAVPSLYDYDLYLGDELRYDVDNINNLRIEKKYSLDHSLSTSDAEQYFIDRSMRMFTERDFYTQISDLSDYQYYLIKRYNPLVNYVRDMMVGYHE